MFLHEVFFSDCRTGKLFSQQLFVTGIALRFFCEIGNLPINLPDRLVNRGKLSCQGVLAFLKLGYLDTHFSRMRGFLLDLAAELLGAAGQFFPLRGKVTAVCFQ